MARDSSELSTFLIFYCFSNLNWDFVLYLKGEEPNVSFPNHVPFRNIFLFRIQQVNTTCKAGRMTYAAAAQARNLQVTGIQDEPATAAEDVNRFAAIEASQQCQELYSTHLILLRHQETPHLGV